MLSEPLVYFLFLISFLTKIGSLLLFFGCFLNLFLVLFFKHQGERPQISLYSRDNKDNSFINENGWSVPLRNRATLFYDLLAANNITKLSDVFLLLKIVSLAKIQNTHTSIKSRS